jgi:hypothetical protein
LPLVNTSHIENILDRTWKTDNGKVEKIKDTLGFEGIFPRWLGIGNMTNLPSNNEDMKSINCLIQFGNSEKEV